MSGVKRGRLGPLSMSLAVSVLLHGIGLGGLHFLAASGGVPAGSGMLQARLVDSQRAPPADRATSVDATPAAPSGASAAAEGQTPPEPPPPEESTPAERTGEPQGSDSDSDRAGERPLIDGFAALLFIPAEELDERPQAIAELPADPPRLREHPEGGRVVLRLWINEFGTVSRVDVEDSDMPEIFQDEARAAFYRMAFVPGKKNGRPARTLMRVEVTYRALEPVRGEAKKPRSPQPLLETPLPLRPVPLSPAAAPQ